MKRFLMLAAFLLVIPSAHAHAQADRSQLLTPPVMLEPANPDGSRCFQIVNSAPYTVTGSVNTNYYETADANKARQRLNFRLGPDQKKRYCTYGPFYPGERLELVLRTLMPIFSCYTVAQGDIVIRGEMKREGGTKTWADCQ